MAQDPSAKIAADYDSVMAQMSALRDEVSRLASTLADAGARQGKSLMNDVNEGMTEAARYVSNKGHDTDVRIEAAVASNPYVALMIAAGMGVMIGALTRR
jgi:ElaB/YqjD/DUF883 family membrane-anchored ribosome-binding protein